MHVVSVSNVSVKEAVVFAVNCHLCTFILASLDNICNASVRKSHQACRPHKTLPSPTTGPQGIL